MEQVYETIKITDYFAMRGVQKYEAYMEYVYQKRKT